MICQYFVWFILYSFLGWIYESCYCSIKEHKWANRGFFFGPIVPIYGFGGLFGTVVFHALPVSQLQNASNIQIFVICAVASAIMEYVTSYTLEKLFHAYWWDYSDMPLNIHGRVCLIFTACFGAAGVVIVRYLIPFVMDIPINRYPILIEVLALGLMLIFGIDLSLTVSTLNDFNKKFLKMNEEINEKIAEKYAELDEKVLEAKEKLPSISMSEAKEKLPSINVAEAREKLSEISIEEYFKHASSVQKAALSHVAGFRHKKEDTHNLMNKGIGMLRLKKEELKKIEKKNDK